MIRADPTRMPVRAAAPLLLALLLPLPLAAQTAPQVTVAIDPEGLVPVGTPVSVTATLLVPTWMPDPPVWPDLQVADAVTRLPERGTRPVTRRIGNVSWSGIARTWEIVPQRPADYDFGTPTITVTYADPVTNAPTVATVPLPPITLAATVPPGAEGIDPFLAATSLTVTATVDGLPPAPKPGDAFTLTLVTTASGPPAILLPPLADRLPSPTGLRAYPREPVLADGDPATRTESVAYVIEAPGHYEFPAVTLDWWNTMAAAHETATAAPLVIDVPGTRGSGAPAPKRLAALAAAGLAVIAALAVFLLLRRHAPRPASPRRTYRALRHTIRSGPPTAIRTALTNWTVMQGRPLPEDMEAPLRSLERAAYGPPSNPPGATTRRALLEAAARAHARDDDRRHPSRALPPLNPATEDTDGLARAAAP